MLFHLLIYPYAHAFIQHTHTEYVPYTMPVLGTGDAKINKAQNLSSSSTQSHRKRSDM